MRLLMGLFADFAGELALVVVPALVLVAFFAALDGAITCVDWLRARGRRREDQVRAVEIRRGARPVVDVEPIDAMVIRVTREGKR